MSQLHHPCHKATTFGTCATTLLRLLIVSKLNNLINLWSQGNSPHYWSQVLGCIPHKLKIDWLLCLPVHSHNTSDMKMAHANKAMAKKNLFTPNQVIFEVNKMKGLSGRLIDNRRGVSSTGKFSSKSIFPWWTQDLLRSFFLNLKVELFITKKLGRMVFFTFYLVN